jgi:Coenzyme PQQ synthesis protein D (PqqD)
VSSPGIARGGTTAPRARADVAIVVIGGEAVIHRHGRVHVLDPVATLVWQCCDGYATVDGIAVELAGAFAHPSDQVRSDVRAAVEQLAALDLLVEPAPGGDEPAPTEPQELLADPPGTCASCGERSWARQRTFRIGSRLIAVGSDDERADRAIAGALAAHLVDQPSVHSGAHAAEPPFFAVELHRRGPGGGPQRLDLLHRGDTVAARSRRPDRIMRALVANLASYGDLDAVGLAPLNGLVVGRGDRAVIVEPPPDSVRFRNALARQGLLVADLRVALVDPERREVVVGAPGLVVDLAPIEALATEPPGHEPAPLPWGRYRVVGICVSPPPTPSSALLAFGPEAGDHRDHESTTAALVALVDSVPVTGSVEPAAIDALLAAG